MAISTQDVAFKYNLDVAKLTQARDRLSAKNTMLYAFCGKMGAGKDKTAEVLQDVLKLRKYDSIDHASFAMVLKQEATELAELYRKETPVLTAAKHFNVAPAHIEVVYDCFSQDSQVFTEGYSGYTRTPEMRRVLQFWGTDVRRMQDENYWVKKTMSVIVDFLASGTSVMVTDARFVNEVNAMLDIGGFVTYLDVTQDTRIERILARDGILPSKEALTHASETALDNFPVGNYSLIVAGDRISPEMTVDIVVNKSLVG